MSARAFAAAAGAQCGFCIPGIVLRAKWLLDHNPSPSRHEIARAIDGHLCRCTGYVKIIDAIELLGRARQGEPLPEPITDGGVGARLERYHSDALTLGEHRYVADLTRPGMLHGALVLSPHARARVVAIDTSAAERVPGVGAHRHGGRRPRPALVRPALQRLARLRRRRRRGPLRWRRRGRRRGDECRGRKGGRRAHPCRVRAPARGDRPRTRARTRRAAREPAARQRPLALGHPPRRRRGRARRERARRLRARGRRSASSTSSSSPRAALAEPPRRRHPPLHAGPGDLRRSPAGGRLPGDCPRSACSPNWCPTAARSAARKTCRCRRRRRCWPGSRSVPSRLVLTREESIRIHPKRHPITMHYTAGCDAEGRLTAVRARMLGDSGAYASVGGKVLERAAGHACGPYRVRERRRRGDGRLHEQPAVRRDARIRRQPGALRDGRLRRPARAAPRDRSVGDPLAQRGRGRRPLFDRAGAREVGRHQADAARRQAALRGGASPRAAPWASRAASRTAASATAWSSGARRGSWSRPTAPCRSTTATPRWARACSRCWCSSPPRSRGCPRAVFRPRVDTTFALGCGQTTGSRATLFGGRAVVSAAQKLRAATSMPAARSPRSRARCSPPTSTSTTPPRSAHRARA